MYNYGWIDFSDLLISSRGKKKQNRSKQVRTINAVLSATTNFYNGVKAHLVRHATATYILQPMARKT